MKYGIEVNSFSEGVETLRKNYSLEMSTKSKAVDFNHLYGCSRSSF